MPVSRPRTIHARVTGNFFATLLVLSATVAEGQTTPNTIVGTVRGDDGRPLEGATVVLDPGDGAPRITTNREGQFRLTSVSVGTHVLRTVRIGYLFDEREIQMTREGVSVEILMRRISKLDTVAVVAQRTGVFGRVLDRNHSPIEGATVQVAGAGANGKSDAKGEFNFGAVKEGAYIVTASRKGFAVRMLSVFVPYDGAVELALMLDSSSSGGSNRLAVALSEFESRARARGSRSAIVTKQAFAGRLNMSLGDALRYTNAFLQTHLVLDDEACLFIDGMAKPSMTAYQIGADEVEAVEVYGDRADYTTTLLNRWPNGMPCGNGRLAVPRSTGQIGLQPPGQNPLRRGGSNAVATIVVWLKRGGE